jgi:transposase-like protein
MTTAQITGQAAAQVAIALRTVPARRLDGTDLRSRQFGLEGLIAKRRDSLYESGRRRGAWVKVKRGRSATRGAWMRRISRCAASGSNFYRAVDKAGRTVDFLLSRRRDIAAAKRFFSRATRQHGVPRVITLDDYVASHRAVAKLKEVGTLPRRIRVRSCKYLNNVVEQDHRRIKQRIRPMLGFKRFETAAVTIRCILVGRENQETTVQPQTTNQKSNHRSGNLARGSGRLKSAKPLVG